LPEKLRTESASLAKLVADSIVLGMGQFCTNPGVIIGMKGDDLNHFIKSLVNEIKRAPSLKMLHPGIAANFYNKRKEAMAQANVYTLYESITTLDNGDSDIIGHPTITTTSAKEFIQNPNLHQEVFGPYSIIVQCESINELMEVAYNMEGQLTTTLMATEADILNNGALIELIKNCCGRFILNNVPTGVEVCKSMHHGGPFPATTDSRFTSVGADGIKRFVRPICFQNWPSDLLPDELKNSNPLQIWRTVNNELTKEPVCHI
jgi:NADP-dependent aldehyde dehydrogenase